MHPVLRLAPALTLLALSACATPYERCVSDAQASARLTMREIARINGNISRGYALHRQSLPYTFHRQCKAETGERYACPELRFHTVTTPVPINMDAEARKLARAREFLVTQQADAVARLQSCQARYPQG